MSRVYNFSAGPAVLPEEVLREAAAEMLDYQGSGMSVMEMSHRSPAYDAIIKKAEADFRKVMNIPDNYKVLFLRRRLDPVRGCSAEPHEDRQGGLHPLRSVLDQGIQGSSEVR